MLWLQRSFAYAKDLKTLNSFKAFLRRVHPDSQIRLGFLSLSHCNIVIIYDHFRFLYKIKWEHG